MICRSAWWLCKSLCLEEMHTGELGSHGDIISAVALRWFREKLMTVSAGREERRKERVNVGNPCVMD